MEIQKLSTGAGNYSLSSRAGLGQGLRVVPCTNSGSSWWSRTTRAHLLPGTHPIYVSLPGTHRVLLSLKEIEKYHDCGSTWSWNSLGYILCVRTFPSCFHREPSRGAPRGQRRHSVLEPPWCKGLDQGETFPVLKLLLRVFFSLWFLRELIHREFQALYEGKLFNLWFLT